jgi:hypothetical protein
MVAVLVAFPLLMLGTLIYVGLSAHDETVVAGTSDGQTGCVACAAKRTQVAAISQRVQSTTVVDERELIAA